MYPVPTTYLYLPTFIFQRLVFTETTFLVSEIKLVIIFFFGFGLALDYLKKRQLQSHRL